MFYCILVLINSLSLSFSLSLSLSFSLSNVQFVHLSRNESYMYTYYIADQRLVIYKFNTYYLQMRFYATIANYLKKGLKLV